VLVSLPESVAAGEIFVGATVHEVDTPFTLKTREGGVDAQLGYRGDRIEALKFIGKPEPYAFVSINTKGDTHYAAAGLSWTFGKTLYVRPGIGLAVHDGSIPRFDRNGSRVDLGSRILFEPEISVGYRVSRRMSAEAVWTHISNAQLFSKQNPGLDMMGVRLAFALGQTD
jgi:hypothetical protein